MSPRHKFAAITAATLVVITSLTGCASKTPTAAKPSNTAAAVTVDVGHVEAHSCTVDALQRRLAVPARHHGVLLAMQKTAQIKITDSKSLATYITQLKPPVEPRSSWVVALLDSSPQMRP